MSQCAARWRRSEMHIAMPPGPCRLVVSENFTSIRELSNIHDPPSMVVARANTNLENAACLVGKRTSAGRIARQEVVVLTEYLWDFDPELIVSATGCNESIAVIHREGGLLDRPEVKKLSETMDANLRPMDTRYSIRKFVGNRGGRAIVDHSSELRRAANRQSGKCVHCPKHSTKWIRHITDICKIIARIAVDHGHRIVIVLQPDIEATRKPVIAEKVALRSPAKRKIRGLPEAYGAYRQDLVSALGKLEVLPVIDLKCELESIAPPLFIGVCHLPDQDCDRLTRAKLTDLAPSLQWPAIRRPAMQQ